MTTPEPRPLLRMAEDLEAEALQDASLWEDSDEEVVKMRARARLLRAADAVIENAGPMAWLLVAEADAHYRTALRGAIAVYRAAEKEVHGHDGD